MDTTFRLARHRAAEPALRMLAGRRHCRRADHRRRHHRRDAGHAAGRAGAPRWCCSKPTTSAAAPPATPPATSTRPSARACAALSRRWDADVARQVVDAAARRHRTSSRHAARSCRRAASAAARWCCTRSFASDRRTSSDRSSTALTQAGLQRAAATSACRRRCRQPMGDVAGAAGPGAVPAAGLRGALAAAGGRRRAPRMHEHSRVLELDAKAKRAVTAIGRGDRRRRSSWRRIRPRASTWCMPRCRCIASTASPGSDAGASTRGRASSGGRATKALSVRTLHGGDRHFLVCAGPGAQGRHPQRQGRPDGAGERWPAALRRPGEVSASLVGAELPRRRRPALHRPRPRRLLHGHRFRRPTA